MPTDPLAVGIAHPTHSSLERDRDEKRPVYARAGVPRYIILDLRSRTAVVYEQPDRTTGVYRATDVVPTDGTLALLPGGATLAGRPRRSCAPPRTRARTG